MIPRGADAVQLSGRQYRRPRYGEWSLNPVRSKNLCMRGISTRENREIPGSPIRSITGGAAQGRLRPHA